jgi:membrane protein
VGLSQRADSLAAIFRWPVTLLIVMIGISTSTALVRAGATQGDAGQPACRRPVGRVSMIFTWYVAEFNNYNRIYGSLGATVGFMTWIWLSVMIVLIGAELDAAIEKRTSRES